MKNYTKALLLACLITPFLSVAQVGIGTNLPNASAQLDVVSSDKGTLITRVALTGSTDATTITNGNIESLLVYNTATVADVTPGYHYWDGTKWVRIASTDDTALDTNTTNVSLTVDAGNLILTDSDDNTVEVPISELSGAASEVWLSQNGTQIDPTDDVPATTNLENIYHFGNVGVGTPYVVGRFHVNSEDSQDVMFSRSLDGTGANLTNDMDVDIVRTYGNSILPTAVTEDGTRIGGLRFRPLVDDSNVGGNPLDALPVSASINAEIEGTPSPTSAPAKLIFTTTPQGSLDDEVRMVINQEGKVNIGDVANASSFGLVNIIRDNGNTVINSVAKSGAAIQDLRSYDDGATSAFRFNQARGTFDAPQMVQDGDNLGQMQFWGYTGRSSNQGFGFGAAIQGEASGIPSMGASNLDTDLVFRTSNGGFPNERMRLTGNGNLGIGDNDPNERLVVNGAALIGDDTAGNADADLTVRKLEDSRVRFIAQNGPSELNLLGYNANANSAVIRLSNARGTGAAPQMVQQDDIIGQLQFWGHTDNANFDGLGFGAAVRAVVETTPTSGDNNPATKLTFNTSNGGFPNVRMVLSGDGNLGIGVANPDEKLVVNGKIKATDVNFSGLPTFEDEASATAGGLTTGDMYKTSTGELRIKL